MEHAAPAVFVALEHSAFAAAIRQSVWIYPAANIGHIVALVIFAGAVAIMDVRLLGGLAAVAPGSLLGRSRRFAISALCAMLLTGFLLFAADASHIAINPAFQIKAVLVGAGIANVAIYQFGAKPAVDALLPGAAMPPRARFAGALSIFVWVAAAACGRSIAYF